MQLFIDGAKVTAEMQDSLTRAVIISLFTWRRADDSDHAETREGWWADRYAANTGDLIGSKLWLLLRSKLTDETLSQAEDYTLEALQWLVDDGLCDEVTANAERNSQDPCRLDMAVALVKDGKPYRYEFEDILNGSYQTDA